MIGQVLGPYRVVSKLGEGGMGQVYRARDTKLERDVAIKILPQSVAHDPERRMRFEREAKTLAALNHPNIAQVYGVEQPTPSTMALAMEFVDGRTLDAFIASRPVPFTDALPIIRQIVDALEAAHEKGIIHRDLKPLNIMVTADGQVKVLDFGLARTVEGDGSDVSAANSPTLTFAGTQAGLILGTARYMSPEQARGRPADRRSDVWAFGCVCYELLTGHPPFSGAEVADILAAVLRSDPDWTLLPRDVPAGVRVLLQRCLERDRKRRVPDFAVVRFLLDDAVQPRAAESAVTTKPQRRTALIALGCAIGGALVAAGATAWVMRPAPAAPRVDHFLIATPRDAPLQAPNLPGLAMSQDGARIVYHTQPTIPSGPALYAWDRGHALPRAVPGSGGAAGAMFISPDGNWIAFAAMAERVLKKVPAHGGTPQRICEIAGTFIGGSWGTDDQIVFATSTSKGLLRVPASGGTPQALTKVDPETGETDHRFPEVLPNGRGVIFTAWHGTPERSRIAMLSPSGEITTLVNGASYAHVTSMGYLVLAVSNTLRAVRFDPATRAVQGTPVTMIEAVGMTTLGGAHFALGQDGSLVYVTGTGGLLKTLAWVDRQGREEPLNVPARNYVYARLSPDGKRIALDVRDQENDIWIWDIERETLLRLTTDPGLDRVPVWSPDGSRIAFTAERAGGVDALYWQAVDGSGTPGTLSTGTAPRAAESFSPDGRHLVFTTPLTPPYDIGMVIFDAPRRDAMLLTTRFSESGGVVSPDGRWLAYQSEESGRAEIYVSPFPNASAGRQAVSSTGGTRPLWSRSGRELFYHSSEPGRNAIMAVPVVPGPTLSLGKATVAAKGPHFVPTLASRHYDVSLDGKRFLGVKTLERDDRDPQIHIALNWFEELKEKVK